MTKLKSKKMTKSTFAVIIMAVVMVAMLAFGGTYAYFTATATGQSAGSKTGKVLLKNNAITIVTAGVVPGMDLLDDDQKAETPNKQVSVVNTSNVETWIFVKFSVTGTGVNEYAQLTPAVTTNGWTPLDAEAEKTADEYNVYYKKASAATDPTNGDTILVTESIIFTETEDHESESKDGVVAGNMDKAITVTLQSASVQAHGLATAQLAFAEINFLDPVQG